MTRPTVRIGGEVQGGGGGAATAWSADWTQIYDQDFSALADEDILPGGDGNVTIDGKIWYARNVSKMSSLHVGATHGGIKIGTVGGASGNYYQSDRTGPAIELMLWRLLDGTDFEGRNDVEFRVTSDAKAAGSYSSAVYESLGRGLSSATYAVDRWAMAYHGSEPAAPTRRRLYSDVAGTLLYGDATLTESDLAYFPNIAQIEMLENYAKISYSSSASAEIGDGLQNAQCVARTSSQNWRVSSIDAQTTLFFLAYSRNSGSNSVTDVTLKRLRVEVRFSPRGLGVFVP